MASSKVHNHSVDLYRIKINPGGTINLDSGDVIIQGNLTVEGTSTSVGSEDLVIADNTITLNDGETGAGVTLNTAGLIIDRGSLSNAHLFFDEDKSFLDSRTGGITNGAYTLENASGHLLGIYTNSIKTLDDVDLYLISEGTGIVSVTGTVDYEKQIFPYTGSNITFNGSNPDKLATPYDNDAIPNVQVLKDYVKAYNTYNFHTKIWAPVGTGNTAVEATDTTNGDAANKVLFKVNGATVAEFFETYLDLNNIRISDNEITSNVTNQNIILSGNGTGSVEVSTAIELTKISDPSAPVDGVKIYSKAESDGATGIFFINEDNTDGELISKNKAILYAMIF
jgi:hypothetical protein